MKKHTVLVAMSGGVDSSVTAALLIDQGYEVIGAHMRLLPGEQSLQGEADARRVAEELHIPFHCLDCRDDFNAAIIGDFCREYRAGRTPNPCVRCNQQFKFGALFDFADELGADYLATGHYARITRDEERVRLCRGLYTQKDQSYFLFILSAAQLTRVLFPLGGLTKPEVRQLAETYHLSSRQKSESQDICFVPDNDYIGFLERHDSPWPDHGEIVHINGKVLGVHHGTHRYTIGQRRGLGIGWTEPLYVVELDAEQQRVVVGEKAVLQRDRLQVLDVIWSELPSDRELRVDCRIRYRHHPALATLTIADSGDVTVVFNEPQYGVTPGQCAVFYVNDCVLGGGWIAS
ncbi:tRNA 2-thiouridine(34) synthase MnmA [uncultured Desulfuromonas sp.]|uniref:tRNA 2-thiouridine(34) synthase MnmA n=1 Tax=uncultured Desulfuromonas sp. TaxID=181013 RepID=UPI002AAAAA3E|nr:tRNA 2-thiouridine(34) synthase MnmA [uncultured Desulfuromonas sp.]